MGGRFAAALVITLLCGVGAGVLLDRVVLAPPAVDEQAGREILYWVAPMDPSYRRDGPGKSPMGMDLVPVYAGGEPASDPAADPTEVILSPGEIHAIGVRTAVARRQRLVTRIETVGFVSYDEDRSSEVHVRAEGWIDALHVHAAGEQVRKGELLFEIYSPEITIAFWEYDRAVKARKKSTIAAAARKLRNYGVSEAQIKEPGADDVVRRLKVFAPQDGVVVDHAAANGMYLKPETHSMTITDLSSVWLLADVFERDVGRLSPDMRAEARLEHLPGRTFEGAIDYIYSELNTRTRTLPVRLRFENPDGLLKPNMFAEVDLISDAGREAVTVPAGAVIRTGRAERVVIALPEGRFRPRLVTTGVSEPDRIEIVQGLEPGERVVASAQFLIDSESNLAAGYRRLAPSVDDPATGSGTLLALDAQARQATIRHGPIEALGWPAMTTAFSVPKDVRLDSLKAGEEVSFALARDADGLLSLTVLDRRSTDGATDAVVVGGIVNAVDLEARTANVSHDEIAQMDMPAMTMNFPLAEGADPAALPTGERVSIAFRRAGDMRLELLSAEPE